METEANLWGARVEYLDTLIAEAQLRQIADEIDALCKNATN